MLGSNTVARSVIKAPPISFLDCTSDSGIKCWCALDLNTVSQKLHDSKCDLGCSGNSSQICGGSLT